MATIQDTLLTVAPKVLSSLEVSISLGDSEPIRDVSGVVLGHPVGEALLVKTLLVSGRAVFSDR